jgi:hypothetical protein
MQPGDDFTVCSEHSRLAAAGDGRTPAVAVATGNTPSLPKRRLRRCDILKPFTFKPLRHAGLWLQKYFKIFS